MVVINFENTRYFFFTFVYFILFIIPNHQAESLINNFSNKIKN